uniref:SAP domain-containing protein n=1 Tax=Leersia perrieri TaxID=77586 RepID=A0A0D9XIH0_9ORYZ
MFRNKVLVRAAPSAPPPPFLLRQVSFPAAVPAPAPALDLDILCCTLSRRHRLACIPQSPSDALVVYQRCQSCSAEEAVAEIAAAFEGAEVGEEEEVVCSGSLVAKAVECGLRCLMLDHGWRCLGESMYVLSTFAATEERTDLCAVNVEVKLGRNDDIEFSVSPDAFQFTTHKMEAFENGKEVILDDGNFQTACTTLPTLQEGNVIGFRKTLPTGQCVDKFMQLSSLKHGLEANYNYYVAVRFGYGSSLEIWLPDSFVLQGSGLQPAPKSSRASRAMSALQSFEKLLLNSTSSLPTWNKAITNARTNSSEDTGLVANFVMNEQSLTLDFRTPKPAVLCSTSVKLWNTKAQVTDLSFDNDDTGNGKDSIKYDCQPQPIVRTNLYKSQVTLLKPSFRREHSDADNSDKLRLSLTNSALVSGSHKRKHAEALVTNFQKVTSKGLLTKGKFGCKQEDIKDYIPQVLDERRAMPGVKNGVLSLKLMKPTSKCVVSNDEKTVPAKTKTKQKVRKDELTAETNTEDVKDELTKKVVDRQKDELPKKVKKAKGRVVINSIELNSMNSKTNPDSSNDDIVRKVADYHKRGELRLLTVADLKCFLSARKVKVGGTKEILIKRVAELLA